MRRAALARLARHLAQLHAGGLARRRVAGRHVHLGPVGHEPLADHAADTLSAAGDEHDFALWGRKGEGVSRGRRDGEMTRGGRTLTSKRSEMFMVGCLFQLSVME